MTMHHIASQVFTSGTTNTFNIINIPQNFQHLQLRFYTRDLQTFSNFDNMFIRFNADYNANYAYHYIQGDGSSAYSVGVANQTFMPIGSMPSVNALANTYGCTIVDIFDYSSTTKNKTFKAISGADANGSGYTTFASGVWMSTSAINRFEAGGQNTGGFIAAGSRVDVYGITTNPIATGA